MNRTKLDNVDSHESEICQSFLIKPWILKVPLAFGHQQSGPIFFGVVGIVDVDNVDFFLF